MTDDHSLHCFGMCELAHQPPWVHLCPIPGRRSEVATSGCVAPAAPVCEMGKGSGVAQGSDPTCPEICRWHKQRKMIINHQIQIYFYSSVNASGIWQPSEVQSTWSREKMHWLRIWSLMAFWAHGEQLMWCRTGAFLCCELGVGFFRFFSALPSVDLLHLPRDLIAIIMIIMMRINMPRNQNKSCTQQRWQQQVSAPSPENKGRLISSELSWFTLMYEWDIRHKDPLDWCVLFWGCRTAYLPAISWAAKDSVWSPAPGWCQIRVCVKFWDHFLQGTYRPSKYSLKHVKVLKLWGKMQLFMDSWCRQHFF